MLNELMATSASTSQQIFQDQTTTNSTSSSSQIDNLQFSSCNTPCTRDKDYRQFKSVTDRFSHSWESRSHVRPTFCNFCQEPLSGMVWTGLYCQVCKLRCHKHCAPKLLNFPCKWTTWETIGVEEGEENFDDTQTYLHQWLEGNLAVNSKCAVCDGVCGSLLRLQDYKCVWCKVTIHESCKKLYTKKDCTLGQCPNSTLNPCAVRQLKADGSCRLRPDLLTNRRASTANVGASHVEDDDSTPVLILVNTRSGDGRRGADVLKKCKRLLNPLQIYDLSNGGADFGLKLFSQFPAFRILICGGDGTVGWVLMCLDRLNLLAKCQVGVLPLGTGNDLSRVLGWGRSFEKIDSLASIIRKMERCRTKLLDRWSILTYEHPKCQIQNSERGRRNSNFKQSTSIIGHYQESVAHHISQVLSSQDYSVVISSSGILCETVKNFITDVGNSLVTSNIDGQNSTSTDFNISEQSEILRQKLDNLVSTLKYESLEAKRYSSSDEDRNNKIRPTDSEEFVESLQRIGSIKKAPRNEFVQREHLMSRADSLKKAVKQIIDQASKAIDEQNEQTMSSAKKKPSSSPPTSNNLRHFLTKFSSPVKFKLSASASPLTATPTSADLPSSSNSSIGASISDARDHSTADSVPDDPIHTTSTSMPHFQRRPATTTSTVSERNANSSDALLDTGSIPNLARLALNFDESSLSAIKKGLLSGGLTGGGSLIAEVLMLNSNVLNFGKLTPDRRLSTANVEQPPLDAYSEKKVMNNYFGVGLDAKIALDFHNKRELCADKTRSRSKLFMMYGVLAGKELMQKTFKNLDQRISLECDGKFVCLPQLQGIVVLNIPSYQGGANFWGSSIADDRRRQAEELGGNSVGVSSSDVRSPNAFSLFQSQAMDDGLLEVVAVFGVLHCATSRLIKLHNHRIAQCQKVKITITGSEPLPVQVDGEAWLQSAGFIQIVHKNMAKVLVSDK